MMEFLRDCKLALLSIGIIILAAALGFCIGKIINAAGYAAAFAKPALETKGKQMSLTLAYIHEGALIRVEQSSTFVPVVGTSVIVDRDDVFDTYVVAETITVLPKNRNPVGNSDPSPFKPAIKLLIARYGQERIDQNKINEHTLKGGHPNVRASSEVPQLVLVILGSPNELSR